MKEGIILSLLSGKGSLQLWNKFAMVLPSRTFTLNCSKCHSFYTGQQKAAAARGRIDKFNRKYGVNAGK